METSVMSENGNSISDYPSLALSPLNPPSLNNMGQPTRILLLEDNPYDAEIILHALRRGKYDFIHTVAANKNEFRTALTEFQPDIVLADYNLPDINGYAAMKILQSVLPDIPMIIVSGTIGEEFAIEALKSGITDYVLKDRLSRLPSAVDRALRDAHDRRERKVIIEALIQSELMWRTVFEASNDIMLILDDRYVIQSCNHRAIESYGYSESELIGVDIRSLKAVTTKTDREEQMRRTARSSGVVYETEHVRKDGTVFQVEVSSKAIAINGSNHFIMAIRDISERKRVALNIEATHNQRVATLLREIHHRVKNNLQIISSLLSLQSSFISDPKALALFKESQDRVRSMALIHEKLYQSKELSRINFGDYIQNLATSLFDSYRISTRSIQLHTEVEEAHLDLDSSIPLALMLNELLTNALKHAFPSNPAGAETRSNPNSQEAIYISLKRHEADGIVLVVKDNGIGFPADIDIETSPTLGLRLIRTLASQLGATVDFCGTNGTEWRITHTPHDSESDL